MARTRATDYDDKRRAILDRSAELFAAHGYDRASMSRIAEACGVSKANLYHYYRDKDEIKEYREKKDPVLLFENELLAEGVLTPATRDAINEAAMAEADVAAAFAEESPDPTVADITKHIYWEEDNRGPNSTSRGTIIFE